MSKKKIQALVSKLATHENFGQFRYLTTDDGEIWFVGVDIAKILGYKNGSRDVNRHVDPEDRKVFKSTETVVLKPVDLTGLKSVETVGLKPADLADLKIPNRGLIFINESGLYSLIFGSKMPEAKKFTRWVTSEVLPSIRKTGSYSTKKIIPRNFPIPPEVKTFKILEPIELDLSKDTKKVRKFKAEHPKYQDCTDWIEYDKVAEFPIDDEFRNFYNDGGNTEEWIREMKNFGRIKYLEVGL